MGAPSIPTPAAAPPPPDRTKAQLNALAYAETQRKLRESSGRKSQFITRGGATTNRAGGTSLLGQ